MVFCTDRKYKKATFIKRFMETVFKKRIGFYGDLKEISKVICKEFKLGELLNCEIILMGYEDFNFSIETTKAKFFVKIFANSRTPNDCKRNIDIMVKSFTSGISIPKLYKSKQGYLHFMKVGDLMLRLCVMDFIEGKNFFASQEKITKWDIVSIANQVSSINSMDIKPAPIENRSAIINFIREFKDKSKYLDEDDLKLMQPFFEKFQKISLDELPHCFAHGDIIKTNVIKDKNNRIWIVDFSASNYYPRVQELAVLACDILFDKQSREESEQNVKYFLAEYQKKVKLTRAEISLLPFYIKIAHSMHVLCANYEKKIDNNFSEENQYFIDIGKLGLRQTN